MARLASYFYILASVIAVIVSTPVKRDIAQVESDVATIKTQVIGLDNSINALSDTSPSLTDALVSRYIIHEFISRLTHFDAEHSLCGPDT